MKVVNHRIGETFGRLKVLSFDKSVGKHKKVLCACECGTTKSYYLSNLIGGKSTSCGCKSDETLKKIRDGATKHGMSRTKTYKAWMSMKERCLNTANCNYPNYGARGIKICNRWLESFENFLEDMGEAEDGKSIDRINNNGDYEPSNCRWATKFEQINNRRITRYITANGETKSLSEWCEETGLEDYVITGRIKRGWSEQDAINTPKLWTKRVT